MDATTSGATNALEEDAACNHSEELHVDYLRFLCPIAVRSHFQPASNA